MDNEDYEPEEVIITSTSEYVTMYDSDGMKILKNYKISDVSPKCLRLLGGEYFVAASSKIPEIVLWGVRDEKSSYQKSPCGTVNALAVSHDGSYIIAALKTEVRVWDILSGTMLASFTKHLQDVTCIQFTNDDTFFVTGGKDGLVLVWQLSQVVSSLATPETTNPYFTWNGHIKKVTDICVGRIGMYSRVATTSLDGTCKLYDLETGSLLATVVLEIALTAVAMDPCEYYLYLGSKDGQIFKINLFSELPKEIHSNSIEAKVKAHGSEVTSLDISSIGDMLVSASVDGDIKLYQVSMFQLMSTTSNNTAVKNAYFAPYPYIMSGKEEYSFTPRVLQRTFSPEDNVVVCTPLRKNNDYTQLSLTHLGSIDHLYPHAVLNGNVAGVVPMLTTESAEKQEDLFQEIFTGDKAHEVKEMNSHIAAYVLDHTFIDIGNKTETCKH